MILKVWRYWKWLERNIRNFLSAFHCSMTIYAPTVIHGIVWWFGFQNIIPKVRFIYATYNEEISDLLYYNNENDFDNNLRLRWPVDNTVPVADRTAAYVPGEGETNNSKVTFRSRNVSEELRRQNQASYSQKYYFLFSGKCLPRCNDKFPGRSTWKSSANFVVISLRRLGIVFERVPSAWFNPFLLQKM